MGHTWLQRPPEGTTPVRARGPGRSGHGQKLWRFPREVQPESALCSGSPQSQHPLSTLKVSQLNEEPGLLLQHEAPRPDPQQHTGWWENDFETCVITKSVQIILSIITENSHCENIESTNKKKLNSNLLDSYNQILQSVICLAI